MGEAIRHRRQDAARAARLVHDRHDCSVLGEIVTPDRQEKHHHQLDDVAARVMVAGFGVLGEAPDQILEDVAHLDGVDRLRIEVQFRKRLHDRQEPVVLVHLLNLLLKVKLRENLLHAR